MMCSSRTAVNVELSTAHGAVGLVLCVRDQAASRTVLPEKLLSTEEQSSYVRLRDEKKDEWLCAHWAAKSAVRALYREFGHAKPRISDIHIVRPAGEPPQCVVTSDRRIPLCRPHISISHAHNLAVALVANPARYKHVGIDLEHIRNFKEETARAFLTQDEYIQLESMEGEAERARYLTQTWCIKEAYLKLIGTGLRTHPRRIEVSYDRARAAFCIIKDGQVDDTAVVSWTIVREVYMLVYIYRPAI